MWKNNIRKCESSRRVTEHRSWPRLKQNQMMAGRPRPRQSKVFVAAPEREEERQGDGQRPGGYPRWGPA